jgi:uncharacterized protein
MGQLLRFLLIFLAIWLVLGFVRTALARRRQHREEDTGIDKMVPCAHCGVHVPQSQALFREDKAYCSEAHRLAGPRQ